MLRASSAPPRARGAASALALGACLVACYGSGKSQAGPGPGDTTTGGSPGPAFVCSAETADLNHTKIEACLGQGATSGACLDGLFAPFMASHTTADALALLQCLEDKDTAVLGNCHPIAHAIGRLTFRETKTVDGAFAACNATCHSGCYHGAMERFLRGDAPEGAHLSLQELQAKAATACAPTLEPRFRFQCLHGLGHALMYYSDYALVASLTLCSSTGAGWNEGSCWGGVFMENLAAADPARRDLSPTDVHYPCNAIDERYGDSCYQMQTSRMSEMGLDSARILVECRKAGAHRPTCMQSLGRDLSNAVRLGNAAAVVAVCETGVAADTSACTGGVIGALIDNTWDGRFALPYCAAYPSAATGADCFAQSVGYLKAMFAKTTEDLTAECAQYAPGSAACAAAAAAH